ncbi:MAG: methyltransferase domain-containing protein [Magnetococcus sp. DMHC-1]|nr:methyltransferase domain-containing protein [Magnetococcales bacterium]
MDPIRFNNAQECAHWISTQRHTWQERELVFDPAWVPHLDPMDLLFLAHFHHQAARCIAQSALTPPRVLEILSRHADRTIQACVAANPATPVPVLEAFARHYSRNLASQAQRNPSLPHPPAQVQRNAPVCNTDLAILKSRHSWEEPYYRFTRTLDILAQVTRVSAGQTWLDAGCSYLMFIYFVLERFPVHITGLDDWNEADKDLMYQPPGTWEYLQRDLEFDFHLDQRQFDFLSALEVLEHIVDTDRFLENCHRYLKPGGYLILTTPNINSLRNRITTPLGIYPNALEYRIVNYHVRLYNKANLMTHLTEKGFHIIAVRGISFLPQRLLFSTPLRKMSEWLADRLPQFCNNILVIAQKK